MQCWRGSFKKFYIVCFALVFMVSRALGILLGVVVSVAIWLGL